MLLRVRTPCFWPYLPLCYLIFFLSVLIPASLSSARTCTSWQPFYFLTSLISCVTSQSLRLHLINATPAECSGPKNYVARSKYGHPPTRKHPSTHPNTYPLALYRPPAHSTQETKHTTVERIRNHRVRPLESSALPLTQTKDVDDLTRPEATFSPIAARRVRPRCLFFGRGYRGLPWGGGAVVRLRDRRRSGGAREEPVLHSYTKNRNSSEDSKRLHHQYLVLRKVNSYCRQ